MSIDLKLQVERYLKTGRCSATRFGREACRDPRFVHDLRGGRTVGAHLAARITRYLAEGER
ncbi:MAG: hypothetical protein RIS52_2563 [Pseudomonadota bacterium]|jgi:2,4-dienoyl-CoA reductase-like NADH-dependent reductase (Old Yellow Enzyme family)